MEWGLVKPVHVIPSQAASHATHAVKTASTGTDLPPARAVAPVDKSQAASLRDSTAREEDLPVLKRETVRDATTDTLIFRVTDPRTDDVVLQIPQEAMLRLRQALADSEESTSLKPRLHRTL